MKSYRVAAEGGLDLWDDIKARSTGIVRIQTDDTEFAIAHLLVNNPQEVRIGCYGPTRPSPSNTHELGRRPRAQIVAIPQHRIREIRTLN